MMKALRCHDHMVTENIEFECNLSCGMDRADEGEIHFLVQEIAVRKKPSLFAVFRSSASLQLAEYWLQWLPPRSERSSGG